MKATHRIPTPAALAAVLALAGAGAAGADEVGKLIFASGDVSIVDEDGQSRPGRQGELILPGERVVTGSGALAQVKMLDGGRVGVRPESSVTFEPPAVAVAGAPTVLTLEAGDVRVLNVKLVDNLNPPEYVLKTSDGLVQLERADTIASLRPPTSGGAAAPTETLLRLSAGNAVVSNKGGSVSQVSVNQLIALTPTELKRGSVEVVPAPPQISTRVTTATDQLSRAIAGTTPLEGAGGGAFALKAPLPRAYTAPAGFAAGDYRLDPRVLKASPPITRVEDKLTPNPITTTPLKSLVPPAQLAAVKGGELPKLVAPPTTLSTFKLSAPTVTKTLTPVVSGSTLTTLPSTFSLSTSITTLSR